jgi:cytochrome c oxidase subunit II
VSLQHRSRHRRLAAVGLLVPLVLFLSGCSAEDKAEIKRLAMPVPASKEAGYVYDFWHWSWLAAGVIGLFTLFLILYSSVRFRRRSETEVPIQTRYNLPIEVLYTLAPVMIVVVFFFFTVKEQDRVQKDDTSPAETITVVGQQWSWTFNYNYGYDDKDAKYASTGGDTVHEGGTTAQWPTLWLVKDKSVRVFLYSPDVIHSFWVPAFLYKMDVVPGRHNHFAFTPTREGTFQGRCAELCGVYHSRMRFYVKVVDQDAYDAHLQELADKGNTGPALGSGAVQRVPGLDPTSESEQGAGQ